MNTLEPKPFKNDGRSFYTYLGPVTVKDVSLQHTERSTANLLDIVFEVALGDRCRAEFLIRLETTMEAIQSLSTKITEAIKNPKPHPWDEDPFDKAVTGKTVRGRNEESLRDYLNHCK